MKRRKTLNYLTILSVLFSGMLGCSNKEDSSPAETETSTDSTITVTEQETPEQTISPLMEKFLSKSAGSMMTVKAGSEIRRLFDMWENVLPKFPKDPMEIHFNVEAEGNFKRDHTWQNRTYREVLDELCQENDLAWKVTESDTIQISKKTD